MCSPLRKFLLAAFFAGLFLGPASLSRAQDSEPLECSPKQLEITLVSQIKPSEIVGRTLARRGNPKPRSLHLLARLDKSLVSDLTITSLGRLGLGSGRRPDRYKNGEEVAAAL